MALCAVLGISLFAIVDLTPEVEADFFFSTKDPQVQSAHRIEQEFSFAPQIFVAARAERLFSGQYLRRIRNLTEDLSRVDGVVDVRSLTRGPGDLDDIGERPFWSRLLLAPDRSASFVVLRIADKDHARTISEIDRVIDRHSQPGFTLAASGVPYVAEHIRRRLANELQRFSLAAFAAFAVLVALLFRSAVLSIALLMGEAERPWYSVLFPWDEKLDQLDKPENGRIGRAFVSGNRRHGRFVLRMEEGARTRPRGTVVREIENIVRRQGFEPVAVGGLYPLQGELATLVEGSVIRGLGGLAAAFSLIVFIVTRSLRTALAMSICLALTPLTLFGLVGLFRMPIDIISISAPAANVALPLGIDEMIHLGHRVRRLSPGAEGLWRAWKTALAELWAPILASMLIVSSGFALFMLSSFPPTQRLGVLVCIGALVTDLVVLVMLPVLATYSRRDPVGRAGENGRERSRLDEAA